MQAQRRFIVLLLSLFTLLLLYQIHSNRSPSPPPIAEYIPKPKENKWSWTDRPPHYPLYTLTPLPTTPPKVLPAVQHKFARETLTERTERLKRQAYVKSIFTKNWASYRTYAWMKDELSPISGKSRNSFGGWAATLVDSLDTLWIMDMKAEFNEAVTAVMDIDFAITTDETINIFETTIRYLGGFLAAYDLSGDVRLLHKAVEVGEMLLVPFDTPNHLPISRWPWRDALTDTPQEAPMSMLVAELGSFSLEFTRLSQLTHDPRWYDAIERITRLFATQQNKTRLPGMWPVFVNAFTADLTQDNYFTLGGMADSTYEYFPKEHALLGGVEPIYETLYTNAMNTATETLLFRPMTPENADILIAGDVRAGWDNSAPPLLEPKGQHLTCFAGGMLALGGRLFQNTEHVAIAKKITDGCIWAYNATTAGVMPEVARYVPCASRTECVWNETLWQEQVLAHSGYYTFAQDVSKFLTESGTPKGYADILDPRYILRPEALESVFIMYRVTGDHMYLDAAWRMFNAINRISETQLANAAVTDIKATNLDGLPPKSDRMESFWLAETLKYAYLIFSEPSLISLDEYVFNTEAHPFRRPG